MEFNTSSKIEFISIEKNFSSLNGNIKAIENVNFKVFPGEFVSLLGQSGCGKSTILNLLANFIEPTAGEIVIDGKPAYFRNRKYGMVFQFDASFPWMTVTGNVGYGINLNKKKYNTYQDLVSYYIKLLGLKDFADKYPRELSGGLRKRVELGRAYASGAEILLLDEPFGSLDVLTKQEMQLLLHRIWEKERKTILFVTHDVEEAIFLSQRVLVMTPRPGTIREEFSIPFSMPRDPALKLSEPFLELRRKVIASLEKGAENLKVN